MVHTVHVVCDATGFDRRITVSKDALVLDLITRAGLTGPLERFTHRPVYYPESRPVAVSIVQSVTSIPEGETLYIHGPDY